MSASFFDMHCHLAFASNAPEAAAALAQYQAGAFAACVTPEEYLVAREQLAAWPCVRVGVGLHPWWLSDARANSDDIEQAASLAAEHAFIGEVGLDFGAAHVASAELQRTALTQIMRAAAESAGIPKANSKGRPAHKLVTLHAVHAADAVLDILEHTHAIEACTCIFHWYSDTPEALQRAIHLGCFFSLGMRSLSTRRGREYARQIPLSQLVLETDEPAQNKPYQVEAMQAQLAQAATELARIKGEEVEETLRVTSQHLLK